MRILSQDGTIDLPYECIGITIGHRGDNEEFYIFAHLVNSAEPKKEPQKLGTYSTETKAQKAMEMLRERHTDNIFCREDIQYKAEIMLDDGLDIVREMMMKCEYFQFPKDEDVEV